MPFWNDESVYKRWTEGDTKKRVAATMLANLVGNRRPQGRIVRLPRGYTGRKPYQHFHVQEKKVIDLAQANYGTNSAGVFTLLNGIAQGDDYNARDGRKVHLKSIFIRGFLGPEDSNTTFQLARIVIFYDKQSNGTTPVTTDLLQASTASAPMNLSNRERFKIIADEQFMMGAWDLTAVAPAAPIAANPVCHSVYIYKKLHVDTIYNTTLATAGSIQTGGLWMLTIGTAASPSASLLTASVRLRFIDE